MMRLKQQREGGNSAISKASKTSMNREYYSDYLPEDPQHGQRNGRAVNPLEGEEEEEDLAIREEFGTSTGTGNERFKRGLKCRFKGMISHNQFLVKT
jgi:hypothetical protein